MALSLPKSWPSCPGCSRPVTGARPIQASANWLALPCECVVQWSVVAKVIKASGANA
jgi:hypothetical protein